MFHPVNVMGAPFLLFRVCTSRELPQHVRIGSGGFSIHAFTETAGPLRNWLAIGHRWGHNGGSNGGEPSTSFQ